MSQPALFDLTGTVALVTGAGQNVGAAIAALLARQGAAVIVNDVVPDRAEEQARAIRESGGSALGQPFDVTDLAAAKAGIAEAVARIGGGVDILVNNAGNGGAHGRLPMMSFAEMPPEVWSVALEVNLRGVMNCTHAVLAGMVARGWGRLITIASSAGTHGFDGGMAHYGAGKGGAIAFTRHIALENARHGVTANSLSLGLVRESGDDPTLRDLAAKIPVGRTGTPQDVAALCLYVASREAGWFTGQTVLLNGGKFTS